MVQLHECPEGEAAIDAAEKRKYIEVAEEAILADATAYHSIYYDIEIKEAYISSDENFIQIRFCPHCGINLIPPAD